MRPVLARPYQRHLERGICFDFLRGSCARGVMCRFSHDMANIQAQQALAQVHAQDGQQAARRAAPICYDFVKGLCSRGADCRYSHDLNSIIHTARGGGGGGGGSAGSTPDVCYDFTRGRCARGAACRYVHDLRALASGAPLAAGEADLAAALEQQQLALAAAWQARMNYQLALLAASKRPGGLPLTASGARATRSLDPNSLLAHQRLEAAGPALRTLGLESGPSADTYAICRDIWERVAEPQEQ
ncbi:hypothetical protein WJX81_006884 [Elliptochloris bilobata]|uniref:C3H1-type domain-containing protein n=1 Tax=Elliptochloris bilobata TaxID=381761 RepID=A0AAW1SD88_9CHLO